MASLYKAKNGSWSIDVVRHGRIRVGKNKADAAAIFRHVVALEKARKYAIHIDPDTVRWLRHIDVALKNRLVKIGLIDEVAAVTIADLADLFLRTCSGKPKTRRLRELEIRSIKEFLGESTPIHDVRPADALELRRWLLTEGNQKANGKRVGYAESTVSVRLNAARAMFRLAVQNEWIRVNPFDKVSGGKLTNPIRSQFVTRAMAIEVCDQLPDAETRLVFALARWAGMRVPSEVIQLRWDGVNWDRMSLSFRSPKTERHKGKETRVCPIFPEIIQPLREALEGPPGTSEWCCPRTRAMAQKAMSCHPLRESVLAAIRRAGYQPWPKLFVNLRASRATEIHAEFGAKAESDWIGHGMDVALQHYLMVTDDTWKRATGATKTESHQVIF